MTFTEITADEFRAYAARSPYKSFMQTPEIATLREKNGWVAYYLAVKQGTDIQAVAMLVAKPTFLGKSTFIAPGGPLLDLEDRELTTFFFRHLRGFIKSHNGYTLHISPYYELIERGRDGEPAEGGFHHKGALANLHALGFHELSHADQPKYLFALDLSHRTPDELLASFKRNTRNHIRKAEKMGVKIRELKKDELRLLKSITESTSQRRHFTDRPLSYYEQMYDLFASRGEAKFILYGDEIVYLFSGSDEKYMRDYNAQYLIQWHMIKYAAEHDFRRYNFYGINGLPDPTSKDYGIYDFKKGFGGQVIELIGTYELPVSQAFYQLHHLLAKAKRH